MSQNPENSNPTKVAIVIQRYGKSIVGGAESMARTLAEKLKISLGYEIDIYTTTAKDYMTWANDFPAETEFVDGIRVFRFPVARGRAKFFSFYDRSIRKLLRVISRFAFLSPIVRVLEWIWIYLQGPVCPALVKAVHQNSDQYKKIVFFCYLYYPTLVTYRGLESKSILIPLAHDEPAFHFQIVRDMLRRIPRMIPCTEPEWDLVKGKLNPNRLPISTPAGLGFDRNQLKKEHKVDAKIKLAVEDGPFLLYLGRISAGKGVHELIDWFCRWKEEGSNSNLRLVLAGHLEDSVRIPEKCGIEYLGFVSDDEKAYLTENCFVMVNPSIYESLSLIVIEAMLARKPVLARRQCDVFRFYATKAPSFRLVGGPEEFSAELFRLLSISDKDLSEELEASKSWAIDRFSWDNLLMKYKTQIEG